MTLVSTLAEGSLFDAVAGGAAVGALAGGTLALVLRRDVERYAAGGAVFGGWAGVGFSIAAWGQG